MGTYDINISNDVIKYGSFTTNNNIIVPIAYVRVNIGVVENDSIRFNVLEQLSFNNFVYGSCIWSIGTYPSGLVSYTDSINTATISNTLQNTLRRITANYTIDAATPSLGSGESSTCTIPLFIFDGNNLIGSVNFSTHINNEWKQENFFLCKGTTTISGNFPQIYSSLTLFSSILSLAALFNDRFTPQPSDPYAGAGDSTTGGGDGTFTGDNDPVNIPSLPTVGATDAGFITLFAPTTTQLKNLASYMWSSLFDIDGTVNALKKLFADPMDCILGLSVVPVSVPTSGVQDVAIGNLLTTVAMNVASQQYIEVDCGSIDFTNKKYFGSYLDYEPYTKIAVFLPYCGVHQLSADDIMGRVVALKYHVDILTGSCVAFLKCGDSVLYEFNGACASNIPVNSLNYASTIENAIRIAVNIGTTVATAGAAAPLTGTNAVARETARNVGTALSVGGSTAEGALSMKPSIGRSGALGGTTGLMGNQTPYFIITRPSICVPKNQNKYKGYPSFIETKIGDLVGQGYTEFDTVLIDAQYLTDNEENELETILKGGVYL